MSSDAVPISSQRHLSLLMRLGGAKEPLSSDEIFASVTGYRSEPGTGPAKREALEKRFERDRALLTEMGFPISVVADPEAPGDRSRWRFELSRSQAEQESLFDLSAEEMLYVKAAAGVWDEAEIAAEARRGYLKFLATTADAAGVDGSAVTQRVRTEPAFGALRDAIALRQNVTFDYRKAGSDAPETRHVAPLQLVPVAGYWLCNCFDHARQGERNFLLRRIVSEVRVESSRTDDHQPATNLVHELRELAHAHPARVWVRNDSDAEVRLTRRAAGPPIDAAEPGFSELTLPAWDHELLAAELAAFLDQVQVVDPPSLAAAVRQRFERVIATHGRTGQGE